MWLQLLTMAGGGGYSIRKPFHTRLKQIKTKLLQTNIDLRKVLGHSPFKIQKLCPALFLTKPQFMKDCDYVSNTEFLFLKIA